MPFAGFIINQVNPSRTKGSALSVDELLKRLYAEREVQAIAKDSLAALLQKLCKNLNDAEQLAALDREGIGRLRQRGGDRSFYVEVPKFDHDIHDLGALAEVGRYLFGGDAPL